MVNKIEIEFSGAGYQVACYVVDEEALKIILNATEEDALYEDNPISVVKDLSKKYIPVANGFDLLSRTFDCSLTINDTPIEIKEIGALYEGDQFEEMFETPRDKTLLAFSETFDSLGEDCKFNKTDKLIIEVIDMKLANLFGSFETNDPVQLEDLKIGIIDLDAPTELSRATYALGLLQSMDMDIKSIIFNDEEHELELRIIDSYASSFYLVQKNNSGDWESEYLG